MDSGAAIFGIIISSFIIVPIVMLGMYKRKREKRLVKAIFDLAASQQGTISQHDYWANSSIGIDQSNNKLYFVQDARLHNAVLMINLADVQKSRFINASRTIRSNESNIIVTDKLELGLSMLDKNSEEIILSFYDATKDSLTLAGELQLITKWNDLINTSISVISKRK